MFRWPLKDDTNCSWLYAGIVRRKFFFSKFINDFLVFNSLLLKIKYKLYVSMLFTSITFVCAFIFKFIVRSPNPGNSSYSHSFPRVVIAAGPLPVFPAVTHLYYGLSLLNCARSSSYTRRPCLAETVVSWRDRATSGITGYAEVGLYILYGITW